MKKVIPILVCTFFLCHISNIIFAQQKVKRYCSVELSNSFHSKGKIKNGVEVVDYGSYSNFTHIPDSALIIASLDSINTFKNKIDLICYMESMGWYIDKYFSQPNIVREIFFSKDFISDDRSSFSNTIHEPSTSQNR